MSWADIDRAELLTRAGNGQRVLDLGEADTETRLRAALTLVTDEASPRLAEGPTVRHRRRDGWVVISGGLEIRLQISVVIPTYNEALSLPAVLTQIPAADTEVIIVDGRSSDDTVDVALAHRPDARIVEERAKGKGAALKAGFEVAGGDIIVVLDADGSMSPGELPLFVDALVRGADVAKGSRCLPQGSSADLTRVRAMGNWFLGRTFNALFGTELTDVTYGYMAFWTHNLASLMPSGGGFDVEAGMLTTAALEGLRIDEVPCHEGRRLYGPSNLKPARDGVRILRKQFTSWNQHRRRRE